MRERGVVNAKPPLMITRFLPWIFSWSKGEPRGPLMPKISPRSMTWRALVKSPALLTVNCRTPGWAGDDAIPKGASPLPNTDSSANCPGR
jgi:hypothetical protein